ncbi:CPBP family intramembrane glutamic endopeptidase [Streptacidiphilus cavernicola]|uniref:Lysostaphin resistance A-like protein n=1 Tax=Streptacidiphilus cavernicola TaxID=3342716 RepID=A0ABV6VVE4_9ACTN
MATAVTVAVLVLANLTNNRWAPGWGLLTAAVTVAVLLAVLRPVCADWADTAELTGLAPATLPRGARWCLSLIGIVAAVYLVGALLPFTRDLFADRRTDALPGDTVAAKVLLYVPFGTVLLEEFAFRGALYGLVRRAHGTVPATVLSSVLFGLWHILPSLHLSTEKPALTPLFGDSVWGAVAADAGAVLFTALSGVVFCELRRRSGSLLAPIGLHWATNALGYVAAYLIAQT